MVQIQTYAEFNKTGLDQLFVYAAQTIPVFSPMVLISFFAIVALATYFSSTRIRGDGDFAASFVVAGFMTVILSVIMSLIPGLMPTTYVVITFVVFMLGVLFLFLSHRK